MPTLAQKAHCERIRQHFRDHHAGRLPDERIDMVREEFQSKFGIHPKYWGSKWKPELRRINALYRRQTSDLVPVEPEEQGPVVIELPGDLNGVVKEQVNKLLETNQELSRRLEEATASLAPLKRSKELLKKIAKELIDQV